VDLDSCVDWFVMFTPGYIGDFSNINSFGSFFNFVTYWVTYVVNYVGIFDCQTMTDVDDFLWIVIIVMVVLSFWNQLLDAIRGKPEK
jgi:hypothetical protein